MFNIRISLGRAMWLEYIILDEEGNSVSEESFYHDVRRAYTRKMKAKEEFKFQEGVNYTLHIGYKWTVPHPYYGHFQLFFSYKFML